MRLFSKSDDLSGTKCKECGTELYDSQRLRRHMEKAHRKIYEKCRVCGTQFHSSDELRKHKKVCR